MYYNVSFLQFEFNHLPLFLYILCSFMSLVCLCISKVSFGVLTKLKCVKIPFQSLQTPCHMLRLSFICSLELLFNFYYLKNTNQVKDSPHCAQIAPQANKFIKFRDFTSLRYFLIKAYNFFRLKLFFFHRSLNLLIIARSFSKNT